jgi:hypothetical protein
MGCGQLRVDGAGRPDHRAGRSVLRPPGHCRGRLRAGHHGQRLTLCQRLALRQRQPDHLAERVAEPQPLARPARWPCARPVLAGGAFALVEDGSTRGRPADAREGGPCHRHDRPGPSGRGHDRHPRRQGSLQRLGVGTRRNHRQGHTGRGGRDTQARAEALEGLLASGTLDDVNISRGPVYRELATGSAQQDVASEMARLQGEIGGPSRSAGN